MPTEQESVEEQANAKPEAGQLCLMLKLEDF